MPIASADIGNSSSGSNFSAGNQNGRTTGKPTSSSLYGRPKSNRLCIGVAPEPLTFIGDRRRRLELLCRVELHWHSRSNGLSWRQDHARSSRRIMGHADSLPEATPLYLATLLDLCDRSAVNGTLSWLACSGRLMRIC